MGACQGRVCGLIVSQLIASETDRPIDTEDKTLMIGGSWEDVGSDLGTTFDFTRLSANDALRFFPCLKKVRIICSWSAPRMITPSLSILRQMT